MRGGRPPGWRGAAQFRLQPIGVDRALFQQHVAQHPPAGLLRVEQRVELRPVERAHLQRDVAEAPVLHALALLDAARLRGVQQALSNGQFAQQQVGRALRFDRRQQLRRGDDATLQQELAEEFRCHRVISTGKRRHRPQASASRSTRSIASVSMGFCR